MDKQKFEDLFKDAFKGAEAEPSDLVWTNIELDLEKDSGNKMKRRLLFFQLLAAASMVFAMGVGSVYYLNNSGKVNSNFSTQIISENRPNSNHITGIDEPVEYSILNEIQNDADILQDALTDGKSNLAVEVVNQHRTVAQTSNISTKQLNIEIGNVTNSNRGPASNEELMVSRLPQLYVPQERSLPVLYRFTNPKLIIEETEPDAGMVLLARLRDEELKYQNDKRDKNTKRPADNLWASVGMSAGTFNPNAPSVLPPKTEGIRTSEKPKSSNPSAGASYSVGASVAGRVAKRLVLQSGVSYLTQNSDYTSSTHSGNSATLNEFIAAVDEMEVTTAYGVNSNLQFLSVPVQAGYVILDRNFAIQINGGVATDFFVQGTLTPDNNSKLEKITYKTGSDSPYRDVNFSGLVGTEFSYRVGNHYRIAINPGMRYALHSIYKSEIKGSTIPITWDVGLNFRYIFSHN
jgi:hypothetical protein